MAKTFEYVTTDISGATEAEIEKTLNRFAHDGWRVVPVLIPTSERTNGPLVLFEREFDDVIEKRSPIYIEINGRALKG